MSPDPDLVAAADRNYIGSYEKLAEHQPAGSVRRFGSVTAFVTGLQVSFLNGCVAPGPPAPAEIRDAVDWLNERGYPYEIFIAEDFADEHEPQLAARGFERAQWVMPAMMIMPPPESPAARAGVTVRMVDDSAALDELLAMQIEAGMPEEIARGMFAPSFVEDPDVRIFTAHLDGRPAGSSIAIRTSDISGVYAVGTLPEARRRGVGTAPRPGPRSAPDVTGAARRSCSSHRRWATRSTSPWPSQCSTVTSSSTAGTWIDTQIWTCQDSADGTHRQTHV